MYYHTHSQMCVLHKGDPVTAHFTAGLFPEKAVISSNSAEVNLKITSPSSNLSSQSSAIQTVNLSLEPVHIG